MNRQGRYENCVNRFVAMVGRLLRAMNGQDAMIRTYLADEYARCDGNLASLKGMLVGLFFTLILGSSTATEYDEAEIDRFVLRVHDAQDISSLFAPCNWFIQSYCGMYKSEGERSADEIAQLAMRLIESNYARGILLKDIAQDLYVSPSYMSKLIKERYGKTFVEILTNIRIERAKALLLNTRSSVQQISSAVGFSEYIYFYKLFRKCTGMSPLQFRNVGTRDQEMEALAT